MRGTNGNIGSSMQIRNKIIKYQQKIQGVGRSIANCNGQIGEYTRSIQKVQEEIRQYQERIRQLEQRMDGLRKAQEKVKGMEQQFEDNYRRRKSKVEAVLNYNRHPIIPTSYCNGMKALLAGKEFERACRGFDNSKTMIKRKIQELLQEIEQLTQRIQECENRINEYQYYINLASQTINSLNEEISGYKNTIQILETQL